MVQKENQLDDRDVETAGENFQGDLRQILDAKRLRNAAEGKGLESTNNSGENSHASHQGSDNKMVQHTAVVNGITTVLVKAVQSRVDEELQINVQAIKDPKANRVSNGNPMVEIAGKVDKDQAVVNAADRVDATETKGVHQGSDTVKSHHISVVDGVVIVPVAAILSRVATDLKVATSVVFDRGSDGLCKGAGAG